MRRLHSALVDYCIISDRFERIRVFQRTRASPRSDKHLLTQAYSSLSPHATYCPLQSFPRDDNDTDVLGTETNFTAEIAQPLTEYAGRQLPKRELCHIRKHMYVLT